MCLESNAIEDQRVNSFLLLLHDLCFYLSADYILESFISCTAASLEHLNRCECEPFYFINECFILNHCNRFSDSNMLT